MRLRGPGIETQFPFKLQVTKDEFHYRVDRLAEVDLIVNELDLKRSDPQHDRVRMTAEELDLLVSAIRRGEVSLEIQRKDGSWSGKCHVELVDKDDRERGRGAESAVHESD